MDSYLDKKPKTKIDPSYRLIWGAIFVTVVALLLMLFATTPERVGPQGVTAFFLIIYLLTLSIIELIYKSAVSKRKYWPFWLRVFYAAVPVSMIALASLRQLTSVDLVVGLLLIVAVTLYHNQRST